MSGRLKGLLTENFDYTFGRFSSRLEGLTDEEYFWEPVPGCMTIRPVESGFEMDARLPLSTGAPFTTIAWRLCHIGGEVLLGSAEALKTGRPSRFEQVDWPTTAASAIEFVREAYQAWRSALSSLPDESMWQPLGPNWEEFGEDPNAALILHVLDEFIHHGAEVGVVRDLYFHHFDGSSGK